ncbi:translation initiation factor 2 [Streptomyces spirodelae]|uniref:translation initiation factor 2 n=1 Tax=Streptomyces spirodelae TaxID=2812904 RepID=UPI0027DCF6B6|nr:translation initiation factor 2 [Streptomyces spirodelae]
MRRAAAETRSVLFVVRTATTLHRLLDAAPALAGDRRIEPFVTLVPGSRFCAEALAALEGLRARQLPWEEATGRPFSLILAASARGELHRLQGPLTLLPHGAGFSKRMPATVGRGAALDAPNGLHAGELLRPDGGPLAQLHALAHPGQLDRLAAQSPRAAAQAAVVGDPTLDRLLESLPRRERYRHALRVAGRRLVAVLSTWGPESLLERRPELPLRLATELPYDSYRTALVLHPNVHARKQQFGLSQDLTPERKAGVLLPRPYEEWAALLVAADCVVTDHGSTALYAAALGLPVLGACDGGEELLPGTPMARLLDSAPRLDIRQPLRQQLERALAGHSGETVREIAAEAFTREGRAVEELQRRLYALLELSPPRVPAEPEPLPVPDAVARRSPALCAFAVDCEVAGEVAGDGEQSDGAAVRVIRRPVSGEPGDHLAAEEDWAGLRHVQSAGLLYRHWERSTAPASVRQWSADVLAAYPACRTAAAVVGGNRCVLRVRDGGLLGVHWEGDGGAHTAAAADPVAVLCGVHAWLVKRPAAVPAGQRVRCEVGGQRVVAVVRPLPVAETA